VCISGRLYNVEPTTGIEPVDLFLTKEALYRLSYVGFLLEKYIPPEYLHCERTILVLGGAGDETRTRDIQLGRLKLYQLSYSRSN
jgi:hypothetical protein